MSPNDEATALGNAFIAHRARLYAIAKRILGCRYRAEDVIQDAYLKVMENTSVLDVRQPVAYLYQVVRNLAIDRHRRTAYEFGVFISEEAGLQVPSHVPSPEVMAINCQELDLAAKALSQLPERTRQAFDLCQLKGYTQRDVAKMLGISTSLVNLMTREATEHCRSMVPTHKYS